jgi:N-acetyl-anhydromuramyl-L-alanine amidase AmpD
MEHSTLAINKNYPANPANYQKLGSNRYIGFIVIHYTGGVGTALANCKYYQTVIPQDRRASAHYFVGHASENGAIYQSVVDNDIAWHAIGRNKDSIGIEVCCHNDTRDQSAASLDWYFDPETIDSLVLLVRDLMKEYRIQIENVIRHYDVTGKTCPAPYVHDPVAWERLKYRIITEDEIMNEQDLNNWYDKINPKYPTVGSISDPWLRDEVKTLVVLGKINGGAAPMKDGEDINARPVKLRHDTLVAITVAYRR